MSNAKRMSVLALALAAGLPASAQAPKITGLVQIWYTQMMDNNLRLNSTTGPYNLRGEFGENTFSIRRTEIKAAGSVGDNVDWEVMFDPTINNNGNSNNTVLQDAAIKYRLPNKVEIRVGQFKNMQTLEGLTSSSELILIERSQLARFAGDIRDRGAVASVGFGDPKGLGGRAHVGLFNGGDSTTGKQNDTNAQKDVVARLEMNYGKLHSFGAYTLQGSTNLADKGSLLGGTFNGQGENVPTADEVLDNKDATSNMGAYYRYQDDKLHVSAELITGQIGRRAASLVAAAGNVNGNRKHLDQQFMGYVATVGYTAGKHSVIGRYDVMNYNSGDKWYADASPYVNATAGTDYTPNYTEITLGYTYAFMPEKLKNANIKVNYVMRSKNFKVPRADQSGEQGGDTLYVCFQTAF